MQNWFVHFWKGPSFTPIKKRDISKSSSPFFLYSSFCLKYCTSTKNDDSRSKNLNEWRWMRSKIAFLLRRHDGSNQRRTNTRAITRQLQNNIVRTHAKEFVKRIGHAVAKVRIVLKDRPVDRNGTSNESKIK